MSKTIITCAVTGGADTVGKHPAIPVTPKQIAEAAIGAARAGAAIAHIHVRNPESGQWSMDLALYREVVERIRDSNVDILINLTTGAGSAILLQDTDAGVQADTQYLCTPIERVRHVLDLRPDICSVDLNTNWFNSCVAVNPPHHVTEMATLVQDAGVVPELEVFDSGDIHLARHLIDEGVLRRPLYFQIVLGVTWAAAATTEAMLYLRRLLPPDCPWSSFGISRHEFPMLAQAALLDGHVRVGLEDNFYLSKGVIAPDNASLVAKAVTILEQLGKEPATADEAREILGIKVRRAETRPAA
jgi:uncharacterized protein (DUF849 family)